MTCLELPHLGSNRRSFI